jgi:adenylosuccinate lyase
MPDATGLLAFMLREMTWVLDGLVADADRMRANAMTLGGIAFSQTALLALVDGGMSRDDAYRVVQRAAAAAWDTDGSFREQLAADPDVRSRLDLDGIFDPSRFLRNLGGVFDRLEKLPVDA